VGVRHKYSSHNQARQVQSCQWLTSSKSSAKFTKFRHIT